MIIPGKFCNLHKIREREKMEILLFGITREIAGSSKISFQPETGTELTVATLKNQLISKYPALSKLSSLAIAVNSEYADDNRQLTNEMEIALIPPVSGG